MRLKRLIALGLTLVMVLALAGIAFAQTAGNYDLTWNTFDGGGGISQASNYELRGVIGQPEAGALQAGGYTLTGGFSAGTPPSHTIFLPLIRR